MCVPWKPCRDSTDPSFQLCNCCVCLVMSESTSVRTLHDSPSRSLCKAHSGLPSTSLPATASPVMGSFSTPKVMKMRVAASLRRSKARWLGAGSLVTALQRASMRNSALLMLSDHNIAIESARSWLYRVSTSMNASEG